MDVTIIKSKRKTVAIQINPDLTLTVRAPKYVTKREIERILAEKKPWIDKNIEKLRARQEQMDENPIAPLSDAKIRELTKRAKEYIPQRVAYFANVMGVDYGRVTIRHQRSRWGSCSSKGNLNFNCLLMLAPAEVIDYVVVHELCHRKEMNHSKAFWQEVENVMPDYLVWKRWLRDSREHGIDLRG